MIHFFIKSTFCITLLYLFYKLFLEREKMHQFNRFYLLIMVVLSVLIPVVEVSLETPIVNVHNLESFNQLSLLSKYSSYLFYLYASVVLLLLLRLIVNVGILLKRIFINEKLPYKKNTVLVFLKGNILPHTFFNYVFVNKKEYFTGKIDEKLLTHEFTHSRELHSLDVIIAELFHIVFWFNPITFYFKKSLKLNHEFIADQAVVDECQDMSSYQKLLVDISSKNKIMNLTSSVNYHLTKQRFLMMSKNSSKRIRILLQLALLPLVFLMFVLFSDVGSENKEEHGFQREHSVLSFTEEH